MKKKTNILKGDDQMSLNKVMLIGNLGADPEIRYTKSQRPVVNLSLATSSAWKDRQTGERKEHTEWHRVVLFDHLAELVNQYLKKGSKVYIEGSQQTRKWQNQQGVDQYTTETVAISLKFLDKKSAAESTISNQPPADEIPENPENYFSDEDQIPF